MQKTKAQELLTQLRDVECDDRGFYSYDGWRAFLKAVASQAVTMNYPFGNDSYDSSEEYFFDDGSCLHIANPRQASFPGRAYEVIE